MHGSHAKYPHWDVEFHMHNASRIKQTEFDGKTLIGGVVCLCVTQYFDY